MIGKSRISIWRTRRQQAKAGSIFRRKISDVYKGPLRVNVPYGNIMKDIRQDIFIRLRLNSNDRKKVS